MQSKLHILVASRSRPALEALCEKLESQGRYAIGRRHIENGHADPLYGLSYVPDVIVMVLNDHGHHDLAALIDEQKAGRPPMIVLAEAGDARTMRLAMQAGARDFLPGVVSVEDLTASIERVSVHAPRELKQRERHLTAIVNAKGGSGATFIACNVAHMLTSASARSTALVSLDMQFESLAHYLDAELRHGLMQVLESVDSLDAVALDAYMTRHGSGLRMLAAQPENAFTGLEGSAAQLDRLLEKMMVQYDHVVVDMPRRVDAFTRPVLQKADRVVLVVQQTLSHLRDATRMLQIFESYGVDSEHVLVVVNRFEKASAVGLDDIARALHDTEIVVVPSDFKTVAESINLGVPMHEHARGSAVTKALLGLQRKLGGEADTGGTGLFKALANVLRKESWSRA
jgi:pilus assembly protein CpaE